MALQPSKLSDFRIVAPLGSGATARVFEAIHAASGQEVAIKMLDPREEEAVGELRERFAREAIALSQLSSRHVAKILGFGFELGQPFLVLERLHGETIDARIKREGPIPPYLLGPWVAQLLVGVRDCHAHSVIHRDLKPANIFLQATAGEPVVKIIDFGVARLSSMSNGGPSLTSTQHLLGSVGYMAPEQFESGKSVGPLTDLYAVGVVVFRCITGKLPFSGGSLDRVIQAKLNQEPALVSSIPGAPVFGALDWFAAKAMAREGSDRFQTAREMLDAWHDIMPLLGTEPTRPQSASVPVAPLPVEQPVTVPPRTPLLHPRPQSSVPPPPNSFTSESSVVQMAAGEPMQTHSEREFVAVHAPYSGSMEAEAASTSENSVLAPGLYPSPDPSDEAPRTRLDIPIHESIPSVDLSRGPDLSPASEVFGQYPPTRPEPELEHDPASVARTARRGPAPWLPRRATDDEATKSYPHLRALVEHELEISRDSRPVETEGPPTTQHTPSPFGHRKNDTPPPDSET